MSGQVFFPHFPECCCPVFLHVSPARIRCLGHHTINQIIPSFFAKQFEDQCTSCDARLDMSFQYLKDFPFETLHYLRTQCCRRYFCQLSCGKIGHGTICVTIVARVEKPGMNCFCGCICLLLPLTCFGCSAHHPGDFGSCPQVKHIICIVETQ